MTADLSETRQVLHHSQSLNPNKRLVLTLYATLPKETNGGVRMLARDLAAELGWNASYFSRIRGELVEDQWLEQVDRIGNSPVYRLGEKALGVRRVIPLRAS